MTLVLCADDRCGLSFHGRRQSRDRAVAADLLANAAGRTLWIEPYSRALFPEETLWLQTADLPWTQAGAEDLCFLELQDLSPPWNGLIPWWFTAGTGTTPLTGEFLCLPRGGG